MDPEKLAAGIVTVQPVSAASSPRLSPTAPVLYCSHCNGPLTAQTPDLGAGGNDKTRHGSNGHDADSISFAKSEGQNPDHRDLPKPQISSPSTHDGIYLRSPATMIACFVLGTCMAVGHHCFYRSLDGDLVGDVDEQQRKLRYGTTFAFITQISLVGSVGFAYTQWLWKTLRKTEITVSGLDAAFSADTQLVSMLNLEMLWKIKLGSLLALVAWCLPISSLITPATLYVIPSTISDNVDALVPRLNISTNATDQYIRFEYSAPFLNNTLRGTNDTSKFFVGPRTILSRLSTATSTTGMILPITPPFANSSYALNFYGPAVKCEEANSTAAAIMNSLLKLKMSIPDGNFTEQLSAYFAFVPDDYILNGGIVNDSSVIESISDIRMQRHTNASNQLWATFARSVLGSDGNQVPETRHIICKLYNASYHTGFSFDAGTQNITNMDLEILNEIEYPKDNAKTDSNFAGHSYSAFMWVLTDQLVGSMSYWKDNSTNQAFSEIATPIEHNSILGSDDLDTYFNYNSMLYLNLTNNRTLSDQRLEDKALAKNRTLAVLIEELSFNTTISLMSSNLLSPKVTTTVRRTIPVNVYSYNSKNLFLAYGIAILFTLVANILGGIGYIWNNASHDRMFSSILGATREPDLAKLFCHKSHGVLPVPKRTRRARLRFRHMDEGGWSFRRMEGDVMIVTRERRKSRIRRGSVFSINGQRVRWGSMGTIKLRMRSKETGRKESTTTV